ncbi:MAG: ROK family protein [Actinomycetota bacterium]|nr:ROK family protein [Actinomycetota bacterium]
MTGSDAATYGIDIGGTKLLALRLGGGATVRAASPRRREDVIAAIRNAVSGSEPVAIGVGVPGLVDTGGVLVSSPHLPGLAGTPLAALVREAWPDAAVWVGNDATAAAWAEAAAGAGRGASDVLTVTLGTGIGGGIVSGGRLQEGARRFAGEWGHMVVDPHGPPCPCGQRGCWERFASGDGLGRLAREAAYAGRLDLAGGDPEAVRGEHVTAAAAAGDAGALAVMQELAWWLALGLANLANIFDPEVIVLGGGLVDAGEVLVAPTREVFPRLVHAGDQRDRIRIVPAELGSGAGAVGAALLASAMPRSLC